MVTDWCDTHPVETIDANITGQLNVATACNELGVHCALVGTGFVYAGKEGKLYTEEDAPDSGLPKAYIKLRIVLEQVLNERTCASFDGAASVTFCIGLPLPSKCQTQPGC